MRRLNEGYELSFLSVCLSYLPLSYACQISDEQKANFLMTTCFNYIAYERWPGGVWPALFVLTGRSDDDRVLFAVAQEHV